MPYTIVKLGISESQRQSLLSGTKIFLERDQFKGDVPVPMTKAQAERVATATRGINLKLSGPQQKAFQQGEGLLGDIGKAALPFARKGVDWALDKVQGKIPTAKAGPLKGVADAAVKFGRKGVNWGMDKLQDKLKGMLGGDAGIAALDAKYGEGWFKDYLLPAAESAAKIAIPIIRGRGTLEDAQKAIDAVHGEGFFSDYLLPGLESAAKIAIPILRGRGLDSPPMDGEGFFGDLLGGIVHAFGGGWEPMINLAQKKAAGRGLRL